MHDEYEDLMDLLRNQLFRLEQWYMIVVYVIFSRFYLKYFLSTFERQ